MMVNLKKSLFSVLFFVSMLFVLPNVVAQTTTKAISGIVVDTKGEPLIGVSVLLKGTNTGTITNVDGKFTLQLGAVTAPTLVVSYIGYAKQEITPNVFSNFKITLEESSKDLSEVVVVGYGTQKRASVVGAITSVTPALLQVGTTPNISNNLAGQLAGVIGVQRSGEPGYDASDIWIRGISTFAGSTSPLVLVDGIERSLNDLDAAEIESFSILKDAAASAVYGVRGANGVILVNTKRGFVGKPKIEIRTEQSVQQPTQLPSFIGAAEYMTLLNELANNAGYTKPFSNDRIVKTFNKYDPDLYPNINWIDAITKSYASNTRTNLNVAGGSDILRYSLTASYYGENGIIARDPAQTYSSESRMHRYNIRSNVDINLSKTTLLRVNIGGYLQELQKGLNSTDDLFSAAFETPPYVHPTVYSDGTFPIVAQRTNPWAYSTQTGYYRKGESKIESLFSLEQDLKMITPGLKAKFTFSFDSYSANYVNRGKSPNYYNVATGRDVEGNLIHSIYSYGQEYLGLSTNADWGNRGTYLEGNLYYNRTFGKHDIDAMLLYNQNSYDNGGIQPYRHQGVAGRLSYTYDTRYVGEFNFGYNGSENFAKGQRFGLFPSVALGWLLSEEKFMQPYKKIFNKIKFRGSYGFVGNDNIGSNRRFAYLTTLNTNVVGYTWGTGNGSYYSGIQEGEIGVNNLTWEKVAKANVGIELGILGMVDLQVDAFNEDRKDIFIQRTTVPTQAGFLSTPYANYGKMNNKGFEVALSMNKQITKTLFMNWRANFTYAKNTVLEKDEAAAVLGTYRSATGLPNNTLWGYTADRLYTLADFDGSGNLVSGQAIPQIGGTPVRPGDIKYIDKNKDGIINSLDEGYIGGTLDPQIVYGFGNTTKYKQFDLSFFFQGVANTYQIIGQGSGSSFFIPGSGQGVLGNIYSNYNDRWTEENPSQNVFWPRLDYGTNYNNSAPSTWWKKDRSFLRLKTLELGYSLKKSLIEKAKLSGVRIYLSGNNLFYLSSFNLWDPELATSTGLKYPSMKSVLFGIQVSL